MSQNTKITVPETLTYGNVKLVPHSKEHYAQTVEWLNSPSIRENFGITRYVTLQSHREWLASQSNFLIWAILNSEGEFLGNISLQITPRHKSAYLQIYIGNSASRGKGFGRNALYCILDYAFCQLKLHRVWLHTVPENKVAISLYRKAGFVQEGIERESILRNDIFRDQIRWSVLEDEWKSIFGKT